MSISVTVISESFTLSCVQLQSQEDLNKITRTFDCFQNAALPEEAILDTSFINDDDDSRAEAIKLFGEDGWNKIVGGMVLFHP